MEHSTIICVLGMHRSGTSLATRILDILGVYLGREEDLLHPLADNPKGFWEHRPLMEVNDEMLSRLGGSWDDPPTFPSGWASGSELEDLRQRAKIIIQKDFADAEVWGWKDPRNCLTLPFWQQLLPPMRYVICLRHPIDVARSLERRNDFSYDQGIYLWLAYLKSALEYTADPPRYLVFFETLMENREQEVQHLARFLGKPELAEQSEVQSAVQDFIDEDLWHHRVATIDPVGEAQVDLPAELLPILEQAYVILKQPDGSAKQSRIDQLFQEALDVIGPAEKKRVWKKQNTDRWMKRVHMAIAEFVALIPPGDSFILVDEDQWGVDQVVAGRRRIPFLERDGVYWGPPPDDAIAIRELERLRRIGANFMVFGWPAFWWLVYYSELHHYLCSGFRCVLHNNRLVVFDLRL